MRLVENFARSELQPARVLIENSFRPSSRNCLLLVVLKAICVLRISRAEVSTEAQCSEMSENLNFRQFPGCEQESSCLLRHLHVLKDSPFAIDRTAHDFKCMIFVDSFVYEIPSSIFLTLKSNITHLYANGASISELRRISFPFGQTLQSVSLAGNQIRGIWETVFYDAPNLETLDLSENQIAEFSPNAFDKLNSLKILDISSNQITTVPFELFQPLVSIVYLNLRSNRFIIRFGVLPEFVKTLDLSYNNIDIHHKFKIFSLMNNLETLLLHGNRIESVHISILESNLKFLGLSDNPFTCTTLADIFLEMEKHNVISAPESLIRNTSNIRGIKCIE
jgi:Leucine-rich repeat (LRR) protein